MDRRAPVNPALDTQMRSRRNHATNDLQETDRTDLGQSGDLYGGYEIWKGWSKPFTVTPEEADYFAGETSGTKIEDGDLLEIGFGSGSFLAWARQCNARVVGAEINPTLV